MGVSVAYHLARLGMQNIVLLEREQLLGAGSVSYTHLTLPTKA